VLIDCSRFDSRRGLTTFAKATVVSP
jgi:hypothetical protein